MTKQNFSQRQGERGNVLFLILIAVALFAALSYAVTQSTRSGGGDAGRETTLVNSSAITQYPASIKTAIVRMIVSNGVTVDNLNFDPPSTNGSLTANQMAANVFRPEGGGATFTQAPASVMADNLPGTWLYNAANRVAGIGTDAASTSGVDVVALLPNVSQAICERIHAQLGLGTIPTMAAAETSDDKSAASAAFVYNAANQIGVVGGSSVLNGQPQGCFIKSSTYYYYHALVER